MDNIKPSNSNSTAGAGSNGSSATLDLRPDNHEEVRVQKEEERQKLLQQQAANSNVMTATGIDGMKPNTISTQMNNPAETMDSSKKAGAFRLSEDELITKQTQESQAAAAGASQINLSPTDQNANEQQKPAKKPGFFARLFGKKS